MKTFFKPTKGKVILAIPFMLLSYIVVLLWLSYFGSFHSQALCLPSLPTANGKSVSLPTPTPQPFTFSNVIADMNYESYTAGGANCLGNGPTEHLATFLYTSSQIIFPLLIFVLVPVFGGYLISCILIFCVTKLKLQKVNSITKSKK